MQRRSPLLFGFLLFGLFAGFHGHAAAQEGAREYQATSVSEEELAKYREQFLNKVNEGRRAGRADKADDRLKTPDDLKFDPILNNAGQWMADLMAKFDDENKPERLECPHEATKIGGSPDMDSPVGRIRYFGWPKDDMTYPGAGTEANAARSGNGMEFSGAMFADQLMSSSTHYRPFYAYKLEKHGDHDYQLMGVGIGKSQRGNFFCCVVFGNPSAPVVKLTDEELQGLPAQIIAKVNEFRGNQGLEPVEPNDLLTASAQAYSKLAAANKGQVAEADEPKCEYQGGRIHSGNGGPQLKDAASFAQFVISGDDPIMKNPKLKHIGIGITLDDKGVPFIAVYAGHP